MEFLIVSGQSGAGKSLVAVILEDMGYFVVDNLPSPLILKFAELSMTGEYDRVALVNDVRGGTDFSKLFQSLDDIERMGCPYKILFMCATDASIIKRYKETRRRHPLDDGENGLADAIEAERTAMSPLRAKSDYVLDSSELSSSQVKRELQRLFGQGSTGRDAMEVRVGSFGFKHGLPMDPDLVFDVRFLPNPYYDLDLRPNTGLTDGVREYVFQGGQAEAFLSHLKALLMWLLPRYVEEGRQTLSIAIGCTGGKHRSVAIAHALNTLIQAEGYTATESHRDLGKH